MSGRVQQYSVAGGTIVLPGAIGTAAAGTAAQFADIWLRGFVVAVLSGLVLRSFSFERTGLNWDESLYLVMAQRWLQGGVPYVAVWDQHPIGIPAIFAMVEWLTGGGLVAIRLALLGAVAATSVLIYAFGRLHLGDHKAGLLAAFLYQLYMARPEGLVANAEPFNDLFVVSASFILFAQMLQPAASRRAGGLFLAALLLGVGLQMKYVVFPEAVAFCLMALIHARRCGVEMRRVTGLALLAMAGGLLPTLLAAGYLWQAGALPLFLDANIRANAAYVAIPISFVDLSHRIYASLRPLAALSAVGAACLILLWREQAQRHRTASIWLGVWLIAAGVDVAMPMKFWSHYFNALIAPLCLLVGSGIVLLVRRADRVGRIAAALGGCAVIGAAAFTLVTQAGVSRSLSGGNVPKAIAERILNGGSSGDDVYVVNYDPIIYFYAAVKPPTPYVLGIELAQYAISSGSAPEAELRRILARNPRWIVVATPSTYLFTEGFQNELAGALAVMTLDSEYAEWGFEARLLRVKLYRR